jgi:hypothetical protein
MVRQLSKELVSEFLEYETKEEDDAHMGDVDLNGIKHEYCNKTWLQIFSTYKLRCIKFIGRRAQVNSSDKCQLNCNYLNYFLPFIFCTNL